MTSNHPRPRNLLLLLAAMTATLTQGCLKTSWSETALVDRPIQVSQKPFPTGNSTAQFATQDGRLTVRAQAVCTLHEVALIDRITTQQRKVNNPETAWAVGAAGGAMALTGGLVLVSAGQTSDSATDTTGADRQRILGAGLLIGGALVATVIATEYFTSPETVQKRKQLWMNRQIKDDPVPCPPQNSIEVPVFAEVRGQRILLGKTDKRGKLDVDLATSIPAASLLPPQSPSEEIQIYVDDSQVGAVFASSIRKRQEEVAWSSADVRRCIRPVDGASCDGVRLFLSRYPHSMMAPFARKALQQADEFLRTNGNVPEDKQAPAASSECVRRCSDACYDPSDPSVTRESW